MLDKNRDGQVEAEHKISPSLTLSHMIHNMMPVAGGIAGVYQDVKEAGLRT